MSNTASHNLSEADRAEIKIQMQRIAVAEDKVAKILAGYFGEKAGKLVYDHKPQEPQTPVVRLAGPEKKLIAVVDFGNGYGCYYDPPGVCERC
jgi:hypothetical protein